jgi:nitroreductase
MLYATRVDTLLAIASRRDERRTLPDPLPPELVLRLLDAGRLSGSSRNAQPWTFAVPTGRPRIEDLAGAVSVPENVLSAGFLVGILVRGKGPVLFDAGRAAQSMLLAAFAEGIASCPNGIRDVDVARRALEAAVDETPVIVLSFGLPERARDPERHTAAEWSARANRKSIDEVVRWLP